MSEESPNKKLISEFEKLIEYIKTEFNNAVTKKEQIQQSFRLKQIKTVLEILKKYPTKITSGNQLADIKGVGKGTVSRIDEVLETGVLSEIKTSGKYKNIIKTMEELEEVFGIGRQTAYDLIKEYKVSSVEDLKKKYKEGKIKLNHNIIIGLKYYKVYQQTIPREEIDQVNELIQSIVSKVDGSLTAQICGSYRRGKSTSNDIDILIHTPKIKTKSDLLNNKVNYLHNFISRLKKEGFILDDLTYEDYHTKYMGFCRLNDKSLIRRLDVYYTPEESYYTSLLHLTGSGEFNRKMRATAIELGYKLNEYGLYKIVKDKEVRIKVSSEKDIFKKLGMEYVTPDKR